MQTADSGVALRQAAQQRTLSIAWASLLFFFALFVGLLTWAGLTVRNVYQEATLTGEATLIVRGPAESLSWRPAQRTIYQGAPDGLVLVEGDSVRTTATAGYGQVATIKLFDASQFDLWAGTELTLETMEVSRWNQDHFRVVMRQNRGYIRYDLAEAQPYDQVQFQVLVGDAVIELTPGGSYSVELRPPARSVLRVDDGLAQEVDVAVRSGSATVIGVDGEAVSLGSRERVTIDAAGSPGLVVPARWDLVRDGGFSQFTEVEYNNTTVADPTRPRSEYWHVYSGPDLPRENQGFFRLAQTCRPPIVNNFCAPNERRVAAWFYRSGGQTSSFTTGIKQELGTQGLGVDISEFPSLRLSLWVRVLYQSLPDTGDRGVECPVMVRLIAKRTTPADPEEQRDYCVFVDEDAVAPMVREPGVTYYPVPLAEWALISFDLREQDKLPDFRYLRSIQIFAQGHDYDSRVTEVSLVGEQ